ncbi:MAG: RNA polymerase sigma factor, partial [Acidimicrobiales bacterium]
MAARSEDLVTCTTERVRGEVDIADDRRLVVAHQRGDRDAFDELYRRYHDRLVQYCWRRVGDRHVAEELAQESFLRALQALPRLAGDRRFYPWLTVIAGRLCIDHHRRDGRVVPSPDLDTGSVDPAHDAVYAAVDRAHLRQAITQLAPRHREVLALREERGWSYQRIAQHLEVPTTTVEALLHRARRALRRQFLAVGGGRLGALPLVSGLVVGVGRLRNRLPGGSTGHFGPWAASAAAGVAAVSLAVTTVERGAPGGETPALSAPSGPSVVVDDDRFPAPGPPAAAAPVEVVLARPAPEPAPAAPPRSPAPPAPTETTLVGPPPTIALSPPGADLDVLTGQPVRAGLVETDPQIAELPVGIDVEP